MSISPLISSSGRRVNLYVQTSFSAEINSGDTKVLYTKLQVKALVHKATKKISSVMGGFIEVDAKVVIVPVTELKGIDVSNGTIIEDGSQRYSSLAREYSAECVEFICNMVPDKDLNIDVCEVLNDPVNFSL